MTAVDAAAGAVLNEIFRVLFYNLVDAGHDSDKERLAVKEFTIAFARLSRARALAELAVQPEAGKA